MTELEDLNRAIVSTEKTIDRIESHAMDIQEAVHDIRVIALRMERELVWGLAHVKWAAAIYICVTVVQWLWALVGLLD